MTSRPYVWWHWMGPNFSKEGITKDLEAMKASGIGGATIFNLTSAVQESCAPTENNPWPGQTYRSPAYWEAVRHAAAEADRLGLEIGLHNTVGYSTTGGPWINEERSMQKVVWTEISAAGGKMVEVKLAKPALVADKGWGVGLSHPAFYRDIAVLAVPVTQGPVRKADVLDISSSLSGDELRWNAPAGQWAIYRFGHASTGRSPHPVPDDVMGRTLEADKMSLEQTRFHWETVISPIKEHLGPLLGKSFSHFLIDSYEAGSQNWTPGFREEFKKRKGYDPLPWLVTLNPVLTGRSGKPVRIVENADETSRFEYDYRNVVAWLYYDNGWKPGSDMIHAAGATLNMEPYGGPFDTVAGAALADLPMVEFWTGGNGKANRSVVGAGQAAGRRVIGAEAFTGSPSRSKWTETPALLKASADGAYATGVNRMILHHWVHQPFDDRYKPGMGMGWWGTHFGRNQTWAELGKEFYSYLGRVQALLQRGETPVDVVSVGSGVEDSDIITKTAFLNDTKVDGGRVVLPSGRSYPVICVPNSGALEPAVVRRIETLLKQGANIVARKPTRSPSLAGYPECDIEVKSLAGKIWGKNQQAVVSSAGGGKLFADLKTALGELGIEPIARIDDRKAGSIRIAPRRDGATYLFFVANANRTETRFVASFRVSGLQPELWDAETGSIQPAPDWRMKNGRTEVDLTLNADKSIFVVFRSKPDRGVTSAKHTPSKLKPASAISVAGPWAVDLVPAVGSPVSIKLGTLVSLSDQNDPAVRYFSGTATYRAKVNVPADIMRDGRRLLLDLGRVCDLVRVTINGRDLGVIWHPPFRRDVTDALHAGENSIELAVANTWHNRLAGDEQFEPDFEWGADRGADKGRALKAYPDWFVKNQPRPSKGRQCFTIWYYARKDTPLIPAGLLGPVRVVPEPLGLEP